MDHVGKNPPAVYNLGYVWLISVVAAMGGLLFGYDWVVIGGAKPFYEKFFDLADPARQGWAMSAALVGCLAGAVVVGGTLPEGAHPDHPRIAVTAAAKRSVSFLFKWLSPSQDRLWGGPAL